MIEENKRNIKKLVVDSGKQYSKPSLTNFGTIKDNTTAKSVGVGDGGGNSKKNL